MAIPAILLTILTFFSFRLFDKGTSEIAITIFIIAYLLLIALIVKGYKSKDIYYDKVNMYLKSNNGVLTVPFSKVKRIKLTLSNVTILGLKFYQYKIAYLDAQELISEIHFWTSIISSELDEFEAEVKKVNQGLKVEHWKTS